MHNDKEHCKTYGFFTGLIEEFNPAPTGFYHPGWETVLIIPFKDFSWSDRETYSTMVLSNDGMELVFSAKGVPTVDEAIAVTKANITRSFEEFSKSIALELQAA